MPVKPTFGIDLGTTHSCIAYIGPGGQPVVAKSAIMADTTPSVVYFPTPNQVIVGSAAKNCAILAPHLVAQLVKRRMGRPGRPDVYHGKEYSPEEISALILRELVRATKENTGLDVEDVVITVPAYFGVAEREATRTAGRIAELNVLDVLAEPVAAALQYQALGRHDGPGVRHLLVCDLGGGTFDTTVISLSGNDVRVVCTDGDPLLGGADWDDRIARHLLAEFTRQHPRLDPTADEQFMQELSDTAEQLKKELSEAMSRQTVLRFAGSPARIELTRQRLEELTADLLDRVVEITRRTMDVARRKGIDRFDDVILVGGMTRMPAVTERLAERLGLTARMHDPDLAVAKGAARFSVIQQVKVTMADGVRAMSAEQLDQVADRLGLDATEVTAMAEKKVTTVVPRAFGVKATDPRDPVFQTNPLAARQLIIHLLRANTPLPADTGPYPFAVAFDNQRMVEIEVWEQTGSVESEELTDNALVGRGMFRDLPPRPMGSMFEITFFMSETGTLTVHAAERESGAEVRFDLTIGGMDEAAVKSAQRFIAKHEVSG